MLCGREIGKRGVSFGQAFGTRSDIQHVQDRREFVALVICFARSI